MATYKRGKYTIKNFKDNKAAAIKYFNNIKNKEYVETASVTYDVMENGYCVEMIYKR